MYIYMHIYVKVHIKIVYVFIYMYIYIYIYTYIYIYIVAYRVWIKSCILEAAPLLLREELTLLKTRGCILDIYIYIYIYIVVKESNSCRSSQVRSQVRNSSKPPALPRPEARSSPHN